MNDYVLTFLVCLILFLLGCLVLGLCRAAGREQPARPAEPTLPAVDACAYQCGRAATTVRGPIDNRVPVCGECAAVLDARAPFDRTRWTA